MLSLSWLSRKARENLPALASALSKGSQWIFLIPFKPGLFASLPAALFFKRSAKQLCLASSRVNEPHILYNRRFANAANHHTPHPEEFYFIDQSASSISRVRLSTLGKSSSRVGKSPSFKQGKRKWNALKFTLQIADLFAAVTNNN